MILIVSRSVTRRGVLICDSEYRVKRIMRRVGVRCNDGWREGGREDHENRTSVKPSEASHLITAVQAALRSRPLHTRYANTVQQFGTTVVQVCARCQVVTTPLPLLPTTLTNLAGSIGTGCP